MSTGPSERLESKFSKVLTFFNQIIILLSDSWQSELLKKQSRKEIVFEKLTI